MPGEGGDLGLCDLGTRMPFPLCRCPGSVLLPQLRERLLSGCLRQDGGFGKAWQAPQALGRPPLPAGLPGPQVQAVYGAGVGGTESRGTIHGEVNPQTDTVPLPRQGTGSGRSGGLETSPPPISPDRSL